MIGNPGIDADVAARVDAYRGNPQALMQKYQQNQQLIDLLALQKLKSEKEAAARDMQLKMAQQAEGGLPTIAQQREQEVLGLTKDEVAKQTADTLGQKQQQQQRAMQGIMQAAGKPRPNPAQAGIARAPSAGMTKMAGGGIVAFANGGLNEETDRRRLVEEAKNYLVQVAPSWYDVNKRSDEQILRDAEQFKRGTYRKAERPAYAAEEGLQTMLQGMKDEAAGVPAPAPQAPKMPTLSLEEELGEMGAPTPMTPRQEGAMMRKPDWQGPGAGPAPQPPQPMGLEQLAEQKLRERLEGPDEKTKARREMFEFLSGMGGRTNLVSGLRGGAEALRGYQGQVQEEQDAALSQIKDLLGVQAQRDIGLKREDVYLQVNQAKSIDDKLKIWTDLFKDQIETLDKALAEDATYMSLKLAADGGDKAAQQRLQQYMSGINQQKDALRKQYQAGVKSIESGMPLSGAMDTQTQPQGMTGLPEGWSVEKRP